MMGSFRWTRDGVHLGGMLAVVVVGVVLPDPVPLWPDQAAFPLEGQLGRVRRAVGLWRKRQTLCVPIRRWQSPQQKTLSRAHVDAVRGTGTG